MGYPAAEHGRVVVLLHHREAAREASSEGRVGSKAIPMAPSLTGAPGLATPPAASQSGRGSALSLTLPPGVPAFCFWYGIQDQKPACGASE